MPNTQKSQEPMPGARSMQWGPLDPRWPEPGFVKRYVRPTSSKRAERVNRVAAQVILGGVQDVHVRIVPRRDGQGESISITIGHLLLYVEDTEALTTLIEVAALAHRAGNRAFAPADHAAQARRVKAWGAVHPERRPPPRQEAELGTTHHRSFSPR